MPAACCTVLPIFSPSRISYQCSDAGICGMVSERQSGFESRTDNAGSEGAVEMLAVTVLSMEMLLLAAQQRVCCGWHAGRETVTHASMVLLRLLSQRPSSFGPVSMSRLEIGACCKTRKPSELSSRGCSCRMVETSYSQVHPRGKGVGKEGLRVQLQRISIAEYLFIFNHSRSASERFRG